MADSEIVEIERRFKALGYSFGLKDAGLITEAERSEIVCYALGY